MGHVDHKADVVLELGQMCHNTLYYFISHLYHLKRHNDDYDNWVLRPLSKFSTLSLCHVKKKGWVSECWRFYAEQTARVIFTVKTCLDVFSLSREQVWKFSALGDRIYEMRCPFVAVGLIACFKVLPHWDNMSQAHMLTHPVTLYLYRADQLCFMVPTSSWAPCKQGPLPFLKSLVWLDPAPTGNWTHRTTWSGLSSPIAAFYDQHWGTEDLFVTRGIHQELPLRIPTGLKKRN